jgi:hypothetical protein
MQKSNQSVNVVRTVSGHYPKCFQPIQEFSTPWLLEHPTLFQELLSHQVYLSPHQFNGMAQPQRHLYLPQSYLP